MQFEKGNSFSTGRPKGAKNRRTTALAKARKQGLDPLDYALDIMRNEELDRAERLEAAKIALPYCHARLNSSHNTSSKSDKSQAEWAMEMAADIEQHDSMEEASRAKGVGEGNGEAGRGDDDETGSPNLVTRLLPGNLSVVGGKAS